ncbi:MAG: hypothetical protein WDW38_009823 [Sanguina aurantia]
MGSRFDADAFERKVRPVYDALDTRNWKAALKACAATLVKYPGNALTLTLKAIALERMGKHSEAMQVCDEALASKPSDEHTLHTLVIVLKGAKRLTDITRMYEVALEKQPGSVPILNGLFSGYLREQNLVKQQQIALRLSKAAAAQEAVGGGHPPHDSDGLLGSERYKWWVVCSVLLQARAAHQQQQRHQQQQQVAVTSGASDAEPGAITAAASPSGAAAQLLRLAETMIVRLPLRPSVSLAGLPPPPRRILGYSPMAVPATNLNPRNFLTPPTHGTLIPSSTCFLFSQHASLPIGGQPVHTFESLLLHADVLLCQGKRGEAAALVNGPAGSAILLPSEHTHFRAATRMAAGDLGKAGALLMSALEENPDDWSSLLLLLDCMLPGSRKAAPSSYTPGHTFTPESPMLLISGGLSECFNVAGGCDASHTTSPGSGESSASSMRTSEAMLAAAVVEAEAFIEGLVAVVEGQAAAAKAGTPGSSGQQQQHLTMRGPFLARVELASRRLTLGLCAPDDVADAILRYCDSHGHLVSASVDLLRYTCSLPAEATARLAGLLQRRALPATPAADASSRPLLGSAERGGGAAVPAPGKASPNELRRRVAALQICDEMDCPAVLHPTTPNTPTPTATAAAAAAAAAAASAAAPCATADTPATGTAITTAAPSNGNSTLDVTAAMHVDTVRVSSSSSSSSAVGAAAAACVGTACALMGHYAEAQTHYVGLDGRERGPADELPGLAVAQLMRAAIAAQTDAAALPFIMQAYLLLRASLESRPFSAPMRLAMAAITTLLGCPGLANAQMRKLDIKHIQLDSLGSHHLLPALSCWAPSDPLHSTLLQSTTALFDNHRSDGPETLQGAYKHGIYSKVLEFVAFAERLEQSHTRSVVRASAAGLQLRSACSQQQSSGGLSAAVAAAAAALPIADMPDLAAGGLTQAQEMAPPPPQQCSGGVMVLCQWLLPHGLAGAIGLASEHILPLHTVTARMAAALHPAGAPPHPRADGASPASLDSVRSAKPTPGPEDLTLQLLQAARCVQQELSMSSSSSSSSSSGAGDAGTDDDGDLAAALRTLGGGLAKGCSLVAERLKQDVSACNSGGCSSRWPGMLPGGALASASGLLLQPLAWVCICMEVGGGGGHLVPGNCMGCIPQAAQQSRQAGGCSLRRCDSHTQSPRRRRHRPLPPGGACGMSPSSAVASLSLRGPSSPTAAHAPLGQRLQHLQRVLGAALDELAAALDGCVCFQTGASPAAAGGAKAARQKGAGLAERVKVAVAQHHASSPLTSWQPGFSPVAVLREAAEQQAAAVSDMHSLALKLTRMLGAASF